MRLQRLSATIALLAWPACVCGLTANDSKQPDKYLVSVCLCVPSHTESGKDTIEKRIEFPQVVAVDSTPCEVQVGGCIALEEDPVSYGQIMKLRLQRLSDGRIKTRFNVELSTAAALPIEDLEGTAVSCEASRFVGVAKLTPGVPARIHCRGEGEHKTWLEMKIVPVEADEIEDRPTKPSGQSRK